MSAAAADRLGRAFYRREAVTVARELLGQRLVRIVDGRRLAGLIVETEAYLGPTDLAAHSSRGKTQRNASMWRDGGHAYVYFIYGVHYCMNVVAGVADEPVAVLLRALEPTEGLDQMRAHRSRAARDTDLCSGPGKLCQALRIERALDGVDLVTHEELFVEPVSPAPLPAERIAVATRIGVGYAGEWATRPLRFYIKDNPHVSRK